jgi:hypothetical protein
VRLLLRGDSVPVDRVPSSVLGDENEHCDGDFHSHTGTIRIRDDAAGPGFYRTLGHEIAHYFLAWGGLSSREKDAEGSNLEEAICDAMGAMLVEVVRDNPELVSQIQGLARRSPSRLSQIQRNKT